MVKIKYKIILLVVSSLYIPGLVMGGMAVLNITGLGKTSVETLEKTLQNDFDILTRNQFEKCQYPVSFFKDGN